MGNEMSDERTFEFSTNRKWIHVLPDNVYVQTKAIAFVKLHPEGAGTARVVMRLLGNKSDGPLTQQQINGQFLTRPVDSLWTKPLPTQEAQKIINMITGFDD